jgi:hypothetical protein
MKKQSLFIFSFSCVLSVEYVIVAFVVERGNTGVILENGGSVGKKLVGRRRGRHYILASL